MFGWGRVIEREKFLEKVASNPQLLDTLMELFAQQSDDTVQTMIVALDIADWQSLQRAVHDLKNIGRSVASTKLIEHSRVLDEMANERQLELLKKSVGRTSKLLAKAGKELKALRKKL